VPVINHESNSESWAPGIVYVSKKIFFKTIVSNQSEFDYYIKAFGKVLRLGDIECP
jgi:hypothetical protein